MLNVKEKAKVLEKIREDFPQATEEAQDLMVEIIDKSAEVSVLLTGKSISVEKSSAISAQLKSFLSILTLE